MSVASARTQWHESLGLRWPVMQAALGGGISTAERAIAVSQAGGLGTIGIMPESEFAAEIDRARIDLGNLPFAANLLMPLVRDGHIRVCIDKRVPVVTLFFGHSRAVIEALQDAGCYVMQQVGSQREADKALAEGVHALIVQGVEAGGHVLATEPLGTLFPRLRAAFPDVPMLAAGGIHDADSARWARELGADGVAGGTRFLLTRESNANAEYKQRLLKARRTILTDLFGFGWHAPHRVVPNAATRRWCGKLGRAPAWVSRINVLGETLARILPLGAAARLTRLQRPGVPFYLPFPATRSMRMDGAVMPLYAGDCVSRIHTEFRASDIVSDLARAFEK